MKKFFQSFYGKLSLGFLVLLAIMGVVQITITMQSFIRFTTDVDQKLNLTLAQDMAVELKSLLGDELDLNKIGERIHYMMVMNPKIEIYLLDKEGKILAFFAEPGKTVKSESVDLTPVHHFIDKTKTLPILGDDPRQPGKEKPFSAAALTIGENKRGYLYIIIGGEQYDSTFKFLRESYIVKTMINGLIITVIFAGIIGLILFALLTKRLRFISGVVSDFEKGDLQKRIPVKSNDEFGHLASSFNQMADTIVANMAELKRNDDLRRELIANVSHDLRSPLTSIQGYLETILMKEEGLSAEERKQYLETILNNTRSLNKLVHELFELSKLDAQQVQPEIENFSLAELAQDVVMKFKKQAENYKIDLKMDVSPGLPQIQGDIGMIERAISNLIDNALQYTPENGSVEVKLKKLGDDVHLAVSDTGIGIPVEDLPHIFDRFYRSKKRSLRKTSSTGLGLAIAKKIIEAHNHTISVQSEENVGTTFSFSLSAV